ncbi:MAG: tyrosyl-tRNA synthetase [Saprospiraceae bacterium]|jgi:tyrosyl-tRNA synthetase
MNFVDELTWRGMLHDSTPGTEEKLASGMTTGYIGFDPTAPSLTIGNYVQLMVLSLWQQAGHQPVYLAGGATGRIGDPSGKDKERQLKSYEELDRNLAKQQAQARKFLDFDNGVNKALMINNNDFYKDMNILDFLRDVGKNLTVNYMMSKDSVKNRLDSGLSFTEFSYQLLQAYDFLCLYKNYNCTFQMGGSDQWGNITSGTEFIRRNIPGSKAYALTAPLLTKSDGKKFGKSEEGNIWLDPEMTSPYNFYQFWINAADADLPKFLKTFSLKSRDEISSLIANEDVRAVKKELAEEMTVRIHSNTSYEAVLDVSEILFNKNASNEKLRSLGPDTLSAISKEIPNPEMDKGLLSNSCNILDLLTEGTNICTSKGDARRAIKNNAISVNKVKITKDHVVFNSEDALHGSYLMIENGKKNKYLVSLI